MGPATSKVDLSAINCFVFESVYSHVKRSIQNANCLITQFSRGMASRLYGIDLPTVASTGAFEVDPRGGSRKAWWMHIPEKSTTQRPVYRRLTIVRVNPYPIHDGIDQIYLHGYLPSPQSTVHIPTAMLQPSVDAGYPGRVAAVFKLPRQHYVHQGDGTAFSLYLLSIHPSSLYW